MSVATVGGRPLTYVERAAGDSLPLVLLHGIGSNGASFGAQIDAFGTTRRILAWNAPGYADSAQLGLEKPSPADYADVLATWLTAVGIPKCILLGHSLGALMATRLALAAPTRVAHLILSSPAQGYDCHPNEALPPGLQARIEDVTALGPAGMAEQRSGRTLAEDATPAMRAAARDAMASVSAGGYAQAVWCLAQGTLVADAKVFLGESGAAMTLLCGTADRVTPLAGVAEFAAAVGCDDLRTIEGAGHASYLDHPDAYNAHLRAILAEVDGRPGA